VASDTARVERGAERITLEGAVRLRQFPQDARQPGVALDTRDLLVLPEQSYAETAQAVVITQGAHTLKSVGLKADFKNDQFELLSQVRGSYVPAP
jgi:lipopolysaccharide export system protein LptC